MGLRQQWHHPLGYAAFAFTLGTAAGALIRRTVPAMVITLAIFAAVQVAMPLWIRPHLMPPDRTVVSGPSFFESAGLSIGTLQASTVPGQPGAWIVSSGAINAAGQPVSTIPAPCLSPSAGKSAPPNAGACMASRGIRETITCQPASRYSPLQWIETGICLALALAWPGSASGVPAAAGPDVPSLPPQCPGRTPRLPHLVAVHARSSRLPVGTANRTRVRQ